MVLRVNSLETSPGGLERESLDLHRHLGQQSPGAHAEPSPSRRLTSSSRRSSSASPDRSQLAGAQLDQRLALLDQLERLVQAGLARVQTADDLLDARRRGLVCLWLGRRRVVGPRSSLEDLAASVRRRTVGAPSRAWRARAAVANGSSSDDSDERVAALERALGSCPRAQAQSLELARSPPAAVDARHVGLRWCTQPALARSVPLGLHAPAPGCPDLAQLLVKARALTVEVRGRCARERRQKARAREHRTPTVVAQSARPRPSVWPAAGPPAGRDPQSPGGPPVQADAPTAASAAWVGVEQLTAATSSSSVRSV